MNNREEALLNRISELENMSNLLSQNLDYISLDWVKKNIFNRVCLRRKRKIQKIYG